MANIVVVKLDSFFSDTQNKTIPAGMEIKVETNSSTPATWEVSKALEKEGYRKNQLSSIGFKVVG